MKKIKIFGWILVLLMSAVSCTKQLDININPSYMGDASVEMLLPSTIAWSASRLGSDLELIGSMWSQHYTQNNNANQYKTTDSYNLSKADYNAVWSSMWAGAMMDCQTGIQKSTAASQWNYYMIFSLVKIFDCHVLNDFYGTIPYSEALMAGSNNFQPKWDESKSVNNALLAEIDKVLAKSTDALALPNTILTKDYIFGGDISKWIQFANTLKLKILMRDFTANQAKIQTLLNSPAGTFLVGDATLGVFKDIINNSNPLFENDRRKLNTTTNISGSKTLINFLKANNDPRISAFYELNNAKVPVYNGLAQGDFAITGYKIDSVSRAKLAATDPVYFISAAETQFLQAEAWARIGDGAKAKTFYDAGVRLAFTRWGMDATPFLAVGGKYAFDPIVLNTAELKIEKIITQKWVAACRCQAWDSFFDQNRTGYPLLSAVPITDPAYKIGQLTVSVNTTLVTGEIPRRLPYPKNSSDFNVNTPLVVPINTKMWWHKQ